MTAHAMILYLLKYKTSFPPFKGSRSMSCHCGIECYTAAPPAPDAYVHRHTGVSLLHEIFDMLVSGHQNK
jgi:hypothetical protein